MLNELHTLPVSGCGGGIRDYVGGREPASSGRQPESGTHSEIMGLAGAGLDTQTDTPQCCGGKTCMFTHDTGNTDT